MSAEEDKKKKQRNPRGLNIISIKDGSDDGTPTMAMEFNGKQQQPKKEMPTGTSYNNLEKASSTKSSILNGLHIWKQLENIEFHNELDVTNAEMDRKIVINHDFSVKGEEKMEEMKEDVEDAEVSSFDHRYYIDRMEFQNEMDVLKEEMMETIVNECNTQQKEHQDNLERLERTMKSDVETKWGQINIELYATNEQVRAKFVEIEYEMNQLKLINERLVTNQQMLIMNFVFPIVLLLVGLFVMLMWLSMKSKAISSSCSNSAKECHDIDRERNDFGMGSNR